MAWISPLARAGFKILEASIAPSAAPAPMIVCISSIKRIISLFFFISLITFLSLSSNSPLYFAPASMPGISRVTIFLSFNSSGTLPSCIRWASPSATAVLPTPASPMRTGLFLVLLLRICMTLSISFSLPITGSC